MPYLHVPLTRPPISSSSAPPPVKISYSLRGNGPVLVAFIPGLCVPADMYDSMTAIVASTAQFTTLSIDNRGIGHSDKPYASLFSAPGYTVTELANDAWDVIDHVVIKLSKQQQLSANASVALVGFSMGGMVVQKMVELRPNKVKFMALLATHTGGLWNMLPSLHLVSSVIKVACSGFDKNVYAAANLSLQYTQDFLDHSISIDDFPKHSVLPPVLAAPVRTSRHRRSKSTSSVLTYSSSPQIEPSSRKSSRTARARDRLYRGVSFVESKLIEYARDANIYFGLSVRSLPERFRHPKQFILDAILNQAAKYAPFTATKTTRRTRWDIYHDRYTGNDNDSNTSDDEQPDQPQSHNFATTTQPPPSSTLTSTSTSTSTSQDASTLESVTPSTSPSPNSQSYSSSSASLSSSSQSLSTKTSTDPTESSFLGHLAVVRSHYVSFRFARALRTCTSIVKLVVIGRHDSVIKPSSSRALASSINANTVIEVDAAHFVTEQATAEVTTQIIYGLRKAFFAPVASQCTCPWCFKQD